jgi:lipopolysaccharide transport system ATP-binding protein
VRARDESSEFGSGRAIIQEVTMAAQDGATLTWIEGGESVSITVQILINEDIEDPIVGFRVKESIGPTVVRR